MHRACRDDRRSAGLGEGLLWRSSRLPRRRRRRVGLAAPALVAAVLMSVSALTGVLAQAASANWKHISQTPTKTEPYYACPSQKGRPECQLIIDPPISTHARGPVKAGAITKGPVDEVSPAYEGSGVGGGLSPANLQSAYNAPSATAGSGSTVAIVDAYNYSGIAENLAVFRKEYGLGECAEGNESSSCFRRVNQTGGTSLPSFPPEKEEKWLAEIALDTDMVSAICPKCHILLVEASEDTNEDLATAENTAGKLGATVISNSFGGPYAKEPTYSSAFDHPGIPTFSAGGDYGYGIRFPADTTYDVAVGGTTLTKASNSRGWTESAWSGTGSGCSEEAKPAWQTDSGCTYRTDNDIAAVADPNTPVSLYVKAGGEYNFGWGTAGGTSAATPIAAAMMAMSNSYTRSFPGAEALYVEAHQNGTGVLDDVVSGSDGSCGGSYLCTAGSGYDGPTGLGSPWGAPTVVPLEHEESELTCSRSATRDPFTGSEWVFAATGSGAINEWAWTPIGGWTQHSLTGGAPIAQGTQPEVVRNPNTGFMAVYYVAQSGQLWNYNTSEPSGTSGWTSYELSGHRTSVAAGTSPSVVFNPSNNDTSVYYVGENKQTWVQQWSAESSWTGYELSGHRTNVAAGTSPSVVVNRSNNDTSVYYVGENAQIWVQQWSAESSWTGYELSGHRTSVAAGTSPSVVFNPSNNDTSVYYVGENKQTWVQQWSAESSWTGYELSGHRTNVAAGTSPSVVVNRSNNDTSVYYVGENAQIWVQQWSAESSWTGYELSGGGAPAAAGASPSATYDPETGATSVYYVATTAPMWLFNWTLETSWTAKALPYSAPYPLTEAATEVTATQGKLKGKVNPDGAETKYYFEYGTTTSYGSRTAEASAGSGTSDVEESKTITGLTASTTYHFRLVASNSHGTTDGEDRTFTTASGFSEYTQTIDSGNSLNAVSCIPSTTDCVASDGKGNAFYATKVSATTSATWTAWSGPSGESPSRAVDCPTSSLCLLADGKEAAGGNLYYTSSLGGSFGEAYSPGYGVDTISCASSSFCVDGQDGAGYFRYSTSPASTSWTLEDQGSASMNGVSCVSSSFCAIVSGAGDVYVADTTSQIESSSWTATDVDGSSALHGVACASTTSCLAVDGAGNVLKLAISEGKATATKQDIDGTNDLTAITCGSSSTCVAIDSAGNIFVTTNGGTSWTKEDTTGTDLTGVSCASTSLCAAVDTTGKVTSFDP
jgi:hypothetical protein